MATWMDGAGIQWGLTSHLSPIGGLFQKPVIADVVDVPGTSVRLGEPIDESKKPHCEGRQNADAQEAGKHG